MVSMIAKTTETFQFDAIDDVLSDIAKGRMVIVTDDADRENEGDLVMAAEKVTPEAAWPCISPARQGRRRAATRRAHRSRCRSGNNGGPAAGGSALRNFARRWHNGAFVGTDGVSQKTWSADLHDPKFDLLSPSSRKARGAGANRKVAD